MFDTNLADEAFIDSLDLIFGRPCVCVPAKKGSVKGGLTRH
jgi:hypothetical protein